MVEKTDHTGLWPSLYDPFRNFGARLAEWLSPASEASSGEDSYEIAMELPGVAEGDVDLTVQNGVLTIRGEREEDNSEAHGQYKRVERIRGTFFRRFTLPDTADAEKVKAKSRNGVLEITIPKQDRVQPRKIEVEK